MMMGRRVANVQPSQSLLLELRLCLFPACTHLCPAPVPELGQDPTLSPKWNSLMEFPVAAGISPPPPVLQEHPEAAPPG